MNRVQFEFDCVDEAAKTCPDVGKHRGRARKFVEQAIQCCPESGNLHELGADHDEIKNALMDRVQELHRKEHRQRAGDDEGYGFPILLAIILGAVLNFLIQWWFHDKSTGTVQIAEWKAKH